MPRPPRMTAATAAPGAAPMSHANTFAPDDGPYPYTTLFGFAVLADDRHHVFAAQSFSADPPVSGFMATLCEAYWQFIDGRLHLLSSDETAYRAVPTSQECRECRTRYEAMRVSEIAAPIAYPPPPPEV